MNIMDVTQQNYTKAQNLYHLTIHIHGESESRISPFSTGTVGIECRAIECVIRNCRDLHFEAIHDNGQLIDVIADVGVFADNISQAVKDIEGIEFLDIWGMGGILQLTPPQITVQAVHEVPELETAIATGYYGTSQA